jgi:hypothetical protein
LAAAVVAERSVRVGGIGLIKHRLPGSQDRLGFGRQALVFPLQPSLLD